MKGASHRARFMLKSPRACHRAEAPISARRGSPDAPSFRAAVAELGTPWPGPAADTYSFRELIALRTIGELRARRIPLRKIGRALESLKQRLSEVRDPLAELKIFSDGRHIAVRVAGQNMEALTGQILFDFDTSELASVQSLPPQPPPPPRERDSEAWFQKGLFLEETGAPDRRGRGSLSARRRVQSRKPPARWSTWAPSVTACASSRKPRTTTPAP